MNEQNEEYVEKIMALNDMILHIYFQALRDTGYEDVANRMEKTYQTQRIAIKAEHKKRIEISN